LDVTGAAASGIDVVLLFVLIGAGKGAYTQIYLLVAIRVIRLVRVLAYWFKIQAFHELRAKAFLFIKEQNMLDFDPTANLDDVAPNAMDEADSKPPIPAKNTKPTVPAHLVPLMGAPEPEVHATGGRSFLKSMRVVAGWAGLAQVSDASASTTSEVSRRLSRRPSETEAPAAHRMSVNRPPTTMTGPPVAPRIPTAMLNLGGLGTTMPLMQQGRTSHVQSRKSFIPPKSSSGSTVPLVPQRPPGGAPQFYQPSPGAPPIQPRQLQSLAAFGLGVGGQRLINQQRAHVQRPGEPSADEV